jgi:hypothetical protein
MPPSHYNIRKLITDAIGNNIRVQSLLLAFVDKGIDGLEGEFCEWTAIETGFKFRGGDTEPEVEAGDGGFWTPLPVEEEEAVKDDAAGAKEAEAGTVTVTATTVVAAHEVTDVDSGVGVEVAVTVWMQEVEDSGPWLAGYFCESNL